MGQLSHREDVPFPIFDADNHLYEPPEALTKFLPKQYKDFVQYVQINGRTKIAIRGHISNYIPNPTFEVVARPGAWEEYFKYGNPDGKTKRELFGEPMRAIPAFFEDGIDDLVNLVGVDQVLYGSDWPHPEGLAEPTFYVNALSHLSVDDQAKIMGGNLGRLVTV